MKLHRVSLLLRHVERNQFDFGHLIRASPCGGFSGHVHLGGDSEQTQNTLGGLDIPSGLGTPRDSQEELGDVWDTSLSLLLTRPGLMLVGK